MTLTPSDAELAHLLEAALALVRMREKDTVRAGNTLPAGTGTEPHLVEMAKALYQARRQRGRYFGEVATAFTEPAWDLMLDLYIARSEGRRVSVSSAAIAADVPPTTALRWIAHLEQEGILRRESDPADRRRTWLSLVENAYYQMERYVRDCSLSSVTARSRPQRASTVASA
ncbi:MarR family transcriptional regulator [Sphingomonas sp. CJ20]